MCRSIRPLHNYDPPTTASEVEEAALQYVRKISGSTKPSQANAEVFERAVEEVTAATQRLLDGLVTSAPPKDRSPFHPDYHPFWAHLEDTGIPFMLHIGGGGRPLRRSFHENGKPPVTEFLCGGENVRSNAASFWIDK